MGWEGGREDCEGSGDPIMIHILSLYDLSDPIVQALISSYEKIGR